MSRRKGAPTPPRRWEPLRRFEIAPRTASQIEELTRITMSTQGCSEEEARASVLATLKRSDEMWQNDRYTVIVDREPDPEAMPGIVHLSIRRNDRKAARDWRDFQRIKNELVGPDREGLELYPREDRVVDTANQFHLWVLPPDTMVPVGWTAGRNVHSESGGGAVQRPLAD